MMTRGLQGRELFQYRSGAATGALVALIVSILHSQGFRTGVWELTSLLAWYGLSLVIGGVSGGVGSFLLHVISVRVPPALEYGVGAIFAVLGYVLQLYLFLAVVFRIVPWE